MTGQSERASAVIAEYLRRRDAGEVVNEQQLLQSHPDLKAELHRYFQNEAAIDQLAGLSPHSNRDTVCEADAGDSVPASHEPLTELPTEFGRYRVLKKLGQGAMGAVYLAHDTALDRKVALKTPKLDAAADPELAERFEREARAAATLHHRNICPVFDVGEIDRVRYLTMAYIDGKPLDEVIADGRQLTERQVMITVRKLAQALEAAHHAGVVHRDLKPANVMVDRSGEPVIMDFGLARKLESRESTRLTLVGTIMGSPAYMSPEQVSGDPDAVGPQSDVYSLGVILYELLTGQLPFAGSIAAVIGQIMTTDPPDVASLRPDLDPRLKAICQKAMAKSTDDRYQSMRELADALSDVLRNRKSEPTRQLASPAVSLRAGAADSATASADELVIFPQIAGADEGTSVSVPPRQRTRRRIRGSWFSRLPPWQKWMAAGFGGMLLFSGVIILFKGGRVEVEEGSTVSITQDGETTRLEISPPDGAASPTASDASTSKAAASSEPSKSSGSTTQSTGWTDLFNGRGLAGWHVADMPGAWLVQGDAIVVEGEGRGFLFSERDYDNFELSLEYRLAAGANSGVYLRAPRSATSSKEALEVAIIDDSSLTRQQQENPSMKVGALHGLAGPLIAAANPIGDWNSLLIHARGRRLAVELNGQQIQNLDLDQLLKENPGHAGLQKTTGRIALQHWGEPRVWFRNIRIRELPDDAPGHPPTSGNSLSTSRNGATGGSDRGSAVDSASEILASNQWTWSEPLAFLESREEPPDAVVAAHQNLSDMRVRCRVFEAGESPPRDLMIISREDGSGEWSAPVSLGEPINTPRDEASPCLSADGLTLMFESDRPGGLGETDLWMSRRQSLDAPFEMPSNLGPHVNSSQTEGLSANSGDGLTLIFASSRTGSQGSSDLWICRRESANDEWSPAENLGRPLNSNRRELAPLLTPDGLVLLFTSDRRGGQGGADVWITRRASADAEWSEPINVGPEVNTPKWDSACWLSPDGKSLLVNTEGRGQSLFRRVRTSDKGSTTSATTASNAAPDYADILTGQWVSLMDELRRRAGDVPNVTLTGDGGLEMKQTGFVIDWLPARNAVLRARVKKLERDKHPELRLRFLTPRMTGSDVLHHWYATYLDDWERFGMGRQVGKNWKDMESMHLNRRRGDDFEWALSAVDDEIAVYVDGKMVLNRRDSSLREGYAVINTESKTIFYDVELMVLDDDPQDANDFASEETLIDIHPHPVAALWMRPAAADDKRRPRPGGGFGGGGFGGMGGAKP